MIWKNLHIYVEKKSKSKYSQYFLSLVAFIESIFFPIPPDLILIPIVYFNPKKFVVTALNCTIFSVIGGAFGYIIGYFIFDIAQSYFDISKQGAFMNFYNDWGIFAVFLGGFTPIPYKVIALTSGYAQFNFIYFILLSLLSRGLRFFIIAFIIKQFGKLGMEILQRNKLLIFIIIPLGIVFFIYLFFYHDQTN
jgi:membrane protein YqaA with SNARE-associated domain